MSHVSLLINAPADQAKNILESLFCEAFHCDQAQLTSKTHTLQDAQGHTMTQSLKLIGPDLILTTQKDADTVTTTYTIVPQDETRCTICLSETALSSVKSRQLNYSFFNLPVIDLFTKKRLKRRLRVLKIRIEMGNQPC
jgi:hypothetical protein